MEDSSAEFYQRVGMALTYAQTVETWTKIYITNYFARASKLGLPVNFDYLGTEELSLGQAIQQIRKICLNEALLNNLNSFREKRNVLAHKLFDYNYSDASPKKPPTKILNEIFKEGQLLCDALRIECDSIK